MAKGHGIIVNLATYLPFTFSFNPTEVDSKKKINYVDAPNIGGSHHEKFFTGFGNKEITVSIICIDKENPIGVSNEVSYFEALREPAPPLTGFFGATLGNENYPPPQVLYNYGTGSLIPLIWDVLDVGIKTSMMMGGHIRGIMGIPRRADVTLTLSLDEDHILNRANRIAKQANQITASINSMVKEVITKTDDKRREKPGIFPVTFEDY